MIELDSDLLIAVHFADFRDQRQKDLDEVSQEIADNLLAQAALAGQEGAADRMMDQLRAGSPWAGVLEGAGLPVYDLPQDAEEISDPDDQRVAQAVYAAPVPIAGQAVYGGTRLDAGRYAVYRLAEVVSGNPDEISPEEREQIRSLIGSRVGEELYAGASRALRSAANVEVFEENL
jgi:peptidyl-prolyl cis-trans isomerase D